MSELRGKRWTACRSISSGRSGGEHTCLGDVELVQIFQEGCLPLTAPRLPPGLVRVFTLLFQQCRAWGPYLDFTWEKAGAEQGQCGLGSGLKPGVREALGRRVTPASPCRPLGPSPNGRSVRPVQAPAETLALSPRLLGLARTPRGRASTSAGATSPLAGTHLPRCPGCLRGCRASWLLSDSAHFFDG